MNWQRLEPSWLPPETVVGPWKIKALHARGAFGVVFRAVLARRAHGGPVALKFALRPLDPRFQREAELLGRIHHPSVPRLLATGEWHSPAGTAYPYLAMEWLQGVPLYEWAEQYRPNSQQVCRVVAQAARALEATHAAGGVHRDVKGGNLLVDPGRLRAFLTDFGACHHEGSQRLTSEGLPPGTDEYRSPEAWNFELHRSRNGREVYAAKPADDVFALGVTAWRLVTGTYLPPVEVREEAQGPGRMEWPKLRPPKELNPRVAEGLSTLILRALSEQASERPTAGELAEALEEMANKPLPEMEKPLFASEPALSQAHDASRAPATATRTRPAVPRWAGYVACTLLGGLIASVAVVGWLRSAEKAGSAPRYNSTGLADTRISETVGRQDPATAWRRLGLPVPETPLEGQRHAPECNPLVEVVINSGCWMEVRAAKPPCPKSSYEWQGNCYVPQFPQPRKPTSETP